MTRNQIDKLMNFLIALSSLLILVGAFFMLLHYQNGHHILYVGFISNFILSSYEIIRLKTYIRKN